MRHFNNYHPLTILVYYLSILIIIMITSNPVVIMTSLILGIIYQALKKPVYKSLLVYLLIVIIIALSNPLISYNGNTVLFYVNNNKYTLEAMLYGANFGLLIITIIAWATNLTLDFTSDKILLLFGKVAPKSTMVLTTAIRFIPLYTKRLQKTREAQKTLGLRGDSIIDNLMLSLRAFSSTLNYSLENAIDTADTMTARGYAVGKRTNFGLYQFKAIDAIIITAVVCLDIFIFIEFHNVNFEFYPEVSKLTFSIVYLLIAVIMALPLIKEIKESIKWKLLQSKI